MTTPDSPVATIFAPAPDHWTRGGGAIKAIVIHMAEGGGTVSWLTRLDGNSSHYVVEYTGRVVQMVDEDRAAGSMNPKSTRADNDAPFVYLGESIRYGRTALEAAGIASDPNRHAIAIEVEGFAKAGPNEKQRVALRRLVDDIRHRRGPLPCLGHRDQQSYKGCPGRLVPWADYGGHGKRVAHTPSETGEIVKSFAVPEARTMAKVKTLAWLYDNSALAASPGNVQLSPSRELVYVGIYSADVRIVAYEPAAGDANGSSSAMFVKASDIEAHRVVSDTTPFSQADIDAAVKADRAKARIVWSV